MTLAEYLSSVSQRSFAKRLGVHTSLVWQWVNGRTKVTAEKALLIEQATGGAVRRQDLRPDLWA